MTVPVQENFPARDPGRLVIILGLQKTTERKGLLPEPISDAVMREQAAQLVAENAGTTWFQHNHRQTGIDVWLKRVKNLTSMPVCRDRKSTRLNSSHANISYAVFCLKKKHQL